MQQARYQKMQKEYGIALRKVNEILEMDPEFPEALFLKAQILWEGFRNSDAAVPYLEKIQMVVREEQSAVRRWACSLLEDIKIVMEGKKDEN